ncbi:hypothetical protein [Enteractinococcus helveticum]|uniref:Uncharacterized protein n=1 Tax=Enteractinococcus helveticum TaxID=1837282 RepID=A0A1B7LY02_9MICC|nr:hypothetical protein [Enteractinococcus helveticum]OAV60155.1 hypothetical protein A6F49_12205 [Enteractinococcus helveticum]
MARKRRAKDYANHESAPTQQKTRADRKRLTVAQAKTDIRQAGHQEGSPGILVFAILAVTVFIGFYYHILALQGMEQLTGGLSMLDHRMSGFDLAEVEQLGERMDDEAMRQYNWIHITAGRIFPIMLGLSLIAVALWTLKTTWARWSAIIVAVGYAGLEIWAATAREQALNDITQANVTLASSLTIAQWLLLFLIVIWIVVILVLKFVGRNSAGLATSLDDEREIGGTYR